MSRFRVHINGLVVECESASDALALTGRPGSLQGAKVTRREVPPPKPNGWDEFDQLARKLVRVPKDEMERARKTTG